MTDRRPSPPPPTPETSTDMTRTDRLTDREIEELLTSALTARSEQIDQDDLHVRTTGGAAAPQRQVRAGTPHRFLALGPAPAGRRDGRDGGGIRCRDRWRAVDPRRVRERPPPTPQRSRTS